MIGARSRPDRHRVARARAGRRRRPAIADPAATSRRSPSSSATSRTGRIGLGFVRGFGPAARRARVDDRARRAQHRRRRRDDDDMARAVTRLAELGGGDVVVDERRRARGAARCPSRGCSPTRGSRRCSTQAARLHRGRARARLRAAGAVPDDVVPRSVRDPEPEDHRPRARRRRPLRARAAARMTTPVSSSPTATSSRWTTPATEHAARLGAGRRTGSSRRVGSGDGRRGRARRPRRRARHARARQHAPPPLPDADAHPGAAGRPVHLAADALPGLGAASTPSRSTRRRARGWPSSRSSGCTTVFDHHYVFPRGREGLVEAEVAGGARARRAHRRVARLDGPRRVGRRPPAGRAGRGARRRARRRPSGSPPSCTSRGPARASRSRSRRARRSRSPGG